MQFDRNGMNMTSQIFADVCRPEERGVSAEVLESVLYLAVEIAREGREGRKIGTIFVVGDLDAVLESSRPMILDPLAGHAASLRRIEDPDLRETLKELAQLDGAFLLDDKGVVASAARYLDVSSHGVDIPLGLGSRHMAAASITRQTDAVAIVVSESSIVRVFDDGEMISEILPEVWMLKHHGLMSDAEFHERTGDEITVRTRNDDAE